MSIHSNKANHRQNPSRNSRLDKQDDVSKHINQTEITAPGHFQREVHDQSSTDSEKYLRCLQYVDQRIRLERKRNNRQRNLGLLCLWFQFACIVWLQLIQPILSRLDPSVQSSQPQKSIIQHNKRKTQEPSHRAASLQNCITLQKPSIGLQTSAFGMRQHPVTGRMKMHNGIDFSAGQGSPIKAAAAGVVTYVGDKGDGYGLKVLIRHQVNGIQSLETLYAHLSQVQIQAKDRVSQGQIIGFEGSTGLTTGPNLHFEVRLDGVPNNPIDFIDKPFGMSCQ